MKIACHAGQLLQPVPGGIGRYVTELLHELPLVGGEAVAFAAGPRPPAAPERVPWIDIGWPRGSARYELWHRARRPAVRIDADVVHAPSLAVPPVHGAPLAVTVHDVAFLRLPENTTRRGARFHRRGLDIARREAALVLAPSAFTRVELMGEGFEPEDVVVVPLGVHRPPARSEHEIDAIVSRLGVRDPFLLTVGTVEPRKDLPTIVDALQRLRVRRPDLELLVIGTPGWGEVRGLDRPGVRTLGWLPDDFVDACYRRARACVIASRYEGYGLAALEAIVRGTPLVAADASALPEVVGDAGLLFPVGDADTLASMVEQILDDDALSTRLRGLGPARAATLTWEASARAHMDAFRLVIARQERRR